MTTEGSFQLKQKLCKQTEGCSMGVLLSVTLIQAAENNVVKTLKPIFCKRLVDDIYRYSRLNEL